jgi:hypothetical protein
MSLRASHRPSLRHLCGSTLLAGLFALAPAAPAPAAFEQQGPKLTPTGEISAGAWGGSYFGASVALSADGNTAVIGAPSDDTFRGAVYVFTRTAGAWVQQTKITGGREEHGEDWFGASVALASDGNTVLIGAPGPLPRGGSARVHKKGRAPRRGSTTMHKKSHPPKEKHKHKHKHKKHNEPPPVYECAGNPPSEDPCEAGAAWVFTRSGGAWTQQGEKFTGALGAKSARFGHSVSLASDGNTALIGGPFDENGRGAAWVFTRSGVIWTPTATKLAGVDESGVGWFGNAVALSGDGGTALIGGPEDGTVTKPNGAVWVFTHSGTGWTQAGSKLHPACEPPGAKAFFGDGVALSGDGSTALIAKCEISPPPGCSSMIADFVFAPGTPNWAQQGRLRGPCENLKFASGPELGPAVSLSANGDTALLGGPYADTPQTANGLSKGAAWVYTRSSGVWGSEAQKLSGSGQVEGEFGARFGRSVALSGDGSTALIGAADDNAQRGAAFVFVR